MQEPLIFDSHAHYTDPAFDPDRDALLTALPDRGVARVMLALPWRSVLRISTPLWGFTRRKLPRCRRMRCTFWRSC